MFRPDPAGAESQGQITRRYHARNQQIVDAADEVLALVAPDRKGGTEDTICRAERKGCRLRFFSRSGPRDRRKDGLLAARNLLSVSCGC